jgi:DNA repair protein RecO
MQLEGIVVQSVPYKERDLIVKLLLRSGLLGSFYVYGGQGGGKHHKPNLLEPGAMVRVQLRPLSGKSAGAELMTVAEYQRLWEARHIRHDVQAYYLLCLYLEVVLKLAQPFHHGDADHGQHDGIFSATSNAVFYLDESVANKEFLPEQQLMIFLVKLLHHLGIMPETQSCGLCGQEFEQGATVNFVPASGFFNCEACGAQASEFGLLARMRQSYATRFQDYRALSGASFTECERLLQYLCQQFHLKPVELKTYKLLFK